MLLAGVQSRARYLVYGLPLSPIIFEGILRLEQWVSASRQIRKKTIDAKTASRQQYIAWGLATATLVGFIILQTILPMALYDNKYALNWLWVSMISFTGLISFSITAFLFLYGIIFIRECKGAIQTGSNNLKPVVDKVKTNKQTSRPFFPLDHLRLYLFGLSLTLTHSLSHTHSLVSSSCKLHSGSGWDS